MTGPRLRLFLEFVTTRPGSTRKAMRLYQQLTGKIPSIMGDRYVGEYLEVVDRSHSTSGGPTIEVINKIQQTLEKIHFVE